MLLCLSAGPKLGNMSRYKLLLLTLFIVALALSAGCSGDSNAEPAQRPDRQSENAAGNPLEKQSPLEEENADARQQDPFGGAGADQAAGGSNDSSEVVEENVPDISGIWAGSMTDESGDESGLRIGLAQDDTQLAGEGELTVGSESVPLEELSGSIDDTGNVEILYQPGADELGSMTFRGTLSEGSISGEMILVALDESDEATEYPATFFLSRS